MKTKIIGCLSAIILLSSTSCSDFLTEDAKGRLTPENYFSTKEELDMAVYALYHDVSRVQTFTTMQIPQWMGDDMTTNPGGNKSSFREADLFSISDTQDGVNFSWERHYQLIKTANPIINNGRNVSASEDEINLSVGQGKFWRAYAYFTLVRIFGPLPMNLDNDAGGGYSVPLSSEADVYAQIVKDLKEAISELPFSYEGSPRTIDGVNVYVTKQAAECTLAAVYMAMAGYPLNKGAEYYGMAADLLETVIKKESEYGFKLDMPYNAVYAMNNNYNWETVLGINYSPIINWWSDSQLASCNQFESLGYGGWGDSFGEIRFWKDFPEGARKDATYAKKLLRNPEIVNLEKGEKDLVDWWELKPDGTPYVSEYHPMFCVFTPNADNSSPFDYTKPPYVDMCNGHRHRLIRYSEVLLWYAESAARAGKDLSLAKKSLKRVRERAEVVNDNINIDAMDANQLAEAAFTEHGWEVAGYWVAMVTRRADQLRMNILKDAFALRQANTPVEVAPGVNVSEVLVPTGGWNDDRMYLPYPASDAQKNPNLKR